jgi:cell division septation protein DedD
LAQQDDYYYEIQLTNKQLVFYFMAGATGLILSFLAGVMVGRGVDANGGEVQARTVQEDKVVTEEAPSPAPSSSSFTYAKRLDGDKVEETLEKPVDQAPAGAPARPAATKPAATKPAATKPAATKPAATEPAPPVTAAARPSPSPKAAAARPSPAPTAAPAATPSVPPAAATVASAAAGAGHLTIQVAALKDKASAEAAAKNLKGKGYAAYVAEASSGLFAVRVGPFSSRPDADKVIARLQEDKFKPYVVKQ